jgi:hypothetical protein
MFLVSQGGRPVIPRLKAGAFSPIFCKDHAVRMLQKKATDLGVVAGNLGQQWRELADQREHEARLGSSGDGVRLQLGLMQPLP